MKSYHKVHPEPKRPLFTVFFREESSLSDVATVAKGKEDPSDEKSIDIFLLYNSLGHLIGIQTPAKPTIVDPERNMEASGACQINNLTQSDFNLSTSSNLPLFPEVKTLLKVLQAQNN